MDQCFIEIGALVVGRQIARSSQANQRRSSRLANPRLLLTGYSAWWSPSNIFKWVTCEALMPFSIRPSH